MMADYDYDLLPADEDDFYPDFYADNEVLAEEIAVWGDQGELPPMSISQLFYSCVQPTVYDGLNHVLKALAWCAVYRISTQTCKIQVNNHIFVMLMLICTTFFHSEDSR